MHIKNCTSYLMHTRLSWQPGVSVIVTIIVLLFPSSRQENKDQEDSVTCWKLYWKHIVELESKPRTDLENRQGPGPFGREAWDYSYKISQNVEARKKKKKKKHCDGGEQMKQKCGKTEIYAFLIFF